MKPSAPLPEDMVAFRIRIAKAESERDTWRASGNQEKCLEAYSMVEALELQLDGLRQTTTSRSGSRKLR
jgi:hypothetical protein